MSTDLATQGDYTPEVAALLAQQEQALSEGYFQTPILKLAQGLTKEVASGDAEAGEFINTLTGESYGTRVGFIVALMQVGRAVSDKRSGAYRNTIDQDLIPDDEVWTNVLGAEFVGTRFDEHPDSEELFRQAVNDGDREWGSGPPITTTYNYTGLVLPSGVEDEDEPTLMPVRLTLGRTTKPAHDKLRQLKASLLRNKPFWDVVFDLSSSAKTFGRHEAFVINVKKQRNTTSDERQLAAELAVAANSGRVSDNSTEAGGESRVKPESEGGLEV